MKRCTYACGSGAHLLSRRGFLGGAAEALGGFGLGGFVHPAAARAIEQQSKRVLVVFLLGGVSQLETWDPKPGTDTGGPFQAIPTSVAGTHISELLPHTAKQMHRIALVRGLNSLVPDHGQGQIIMETGRRMEPAMKYPHLGSVCAKLLDSDDNPLPGFIRVTPKGNGGSGGDSAFLGPRYASIGLGDGQAPPNLTRPDGLSADGDRLRKDFRHHADQHFLLKRRTAETEAYTSSYDQAARMMTKRDLFSIEKEDPRMADRYGRHDFGRHCQMARRLLEGGATFVKVTHTNYDTHHENFDFHIEQLGEFDRPFATLLDDLAERGLLDSTLVVVMSEMGRTPAINRNLGRDHWAKAWSVALAGCGIKGGAVSGKTNANGTAVVEGEVHGGHLFHTYLKALGFDSKKNWYIDQRPIPMADPKAAPIPEVLA